MSVVCLQVEVSAAGLSLVRRSPTERGVSECDCEASITRRPWPSRGCCATKKKLPSCVFVLILRPSSRAKSMEKMSYSYERIYRLLSL